MEGVAEHVSAVDVPAASHGPAGAALVISGDGDCDSPRCLSPTPSPLEPFQASRRTSRTSGPSRRRECLADEACTQ